MIVFAALPKRFAAISSPSVPLPALLKFMEIFECVAASSSSPPNDVMYVICTEWQKRMNSNLSDQVQSMELTFPVFSGVGDRESESFFSSSTDFAGSSFAA